MFYNQIKKLCLQKGISITAFVESGLNMSRSNVTKWREGKVPKSDTIQKIADYFGVTTDYLLTGSDNKKSSDIKPKDDVPEEFVLMARKTGDIPPEQRKRLYKFLDSTIDNFLEALKDEQSDK